MRRGLLTAVLCVCSLVALVLGADAHQGAAHAPAIPHTPPQAPPRPSDDPLTVVGGTLVRDGHTTHVAGVNAYSAATWYGTNWGCGAPIYNLPQLFSQVPLGGLVRVWAFQALGWNNKVTPGHVDFTGIDRVVAGAAAAHRQLILTLSDQAGTCDDGHWHDEAWYDGGYRASRSNDDGRGLGNLSYLAWLKLIVARYATNPAVAVWEPVNEPEASDCTGAVGSGCEDPARRTCPDGAAASLASFFTSVGGLIHALDPHSVVSEGVAGGAQCGLAGAGFATVGASPGVNLLTYHDYGDSSPLPAGLRDRLAQARSLAKPLLVEEAGVIAGAACGSLSARASLVAGKARAALAAGAVGWMPWWYDESGPGSGCGQDYGPNDPALAALSRVTTEANGMQSRRLSDAVAGAG